MFLFRRKHVRSTQIIQGQHITQADEANVYRFFFFSFKGADPFSSLDLITTILKNQDYEFLTQKIYFSIIESQNTKKKVQELVEINLSFKGADPSSSLDLITTMLKNQDYKFLTQKFIFQLLMKAKTQKKNPRTCRNQFINPINPKKTQSQNQTTQIFSSFIQILFLNNIETLNNYCKTPHGIELIIINLNYFDS